MIKLISNNITQEALDIMFLGLDTKVTLSTDKELEKFINAKAEIGFDTESTGLDCKESDLLLLQLGDKGVQFIIDYINIDESTVRLLLSFFSETRILKVGQNLKYDGKVIKHNFDAYLIRTHDLMLVEQLRTAGQGVTANLADLHTRYLNKTLVKGQGKNITKENYLTPDVLIYAAKDVEDILEIKSLQLYKYLREGNTASLYTLEHDFINVLIDIEYWGIKIDKEKYIREVITFLDDIEIKVEKLLNEIIRKASKTTITKFRKYILAVALDLFGGESEHFDSKNNSSSKGNTKRATKPTVTQNKDGQYEIKKSELDKTGEFNINYNSPIDVPDLCVAFGIELPKTDAGNLSTAREAIEDIASVKAQKFITNKDIISLYNYLIEIAYSSIPETLEEQRELFIDALLGKRSSGTLISNYGLSLINKLDKYDRIHTEFMLAETGRLRSRNENLQKIPKNPLFRDCFISENGWVIIGADFTAAELVIIADGSQEPSLVNAFKNNEDVHSSVATKVSGKLVTKATEPELRERAKRVSYGLAYGAGADKFKKDFGSKEAAQAYIKEYKRGLPKVTNYLASLSAFAEARGYSVTKAPYLRRRYYPDFAGPATNFKAMAAIKREATNAHIQGTQADILKLAMVQLWHKIRKLGYDKDVRFILTVHDEILLEVRNISEEFLTEVKGLLEYHMKRASELVLKVLPIKAEAYISTRWNK